MDAGGSIPPSSTNNIRQCPFGPSSGKGGQLDLFCFTMNQPELPQVKGRYGTVAQWLERKPDKLEVDGSIPSRPTMKQMLAEDYIAYPAGDAGPIPAFGAICRNRLMARTPKNSLLKFLLFL